MVRFKDGPAKGQVLMLRRAPKLLRVTFYVNLDKKDVWDALDAPEDTPRTVEKLYAYERIGEATNCHVRMTKGSGFYALAEYQFVNEQPEDAVMRDETRWRAWAGSYTPTV